MFALLTSIWRPKEKTTSTTSRNRVSAMEKELRGPELSTPR